MSNSGLITASRNAAKISRGYDFEKTRATISVNLSMARNHTPGKLMSARPYYWSWTVVIASTGAGKSMPFIMPLLVDETCHKVVIIISGAFRVHLDHFFN